MAGLFASASEIGTETGGTGCHRHANEVRQGRSKMREISHHETWMSAEAAEAHEMALFLQAQAFPTTRLFRHHPAEVATSQEEEDEATSRIEEVVEEDRRWMTATSSDATDRLHLLADGRRETCSVMTVSPSAGTDLTAVMMSVGPNGPIEREKGISIDSAAIHHPCRDWTAEHRQIPLPVEVSDTRPLRPLQSTPRVLL